MEWDKSGQLFIIKELQVRKQLERNELIFEILFPMYRYSRRLVLTDRFMEANYSFLEFTSIVNVNRARIRVIKI